MKNPTYTPHTFASVVLTAVGYVVLWAVVDTYNTPTAWWLFGAASAVLPIQEAYRWGYREGIKDSGGDIYENQ